MKASCALSWWSLALAALACQRQPSGSAAPSPSAVPVTAPSAAPADGRLPEDPVAGARAVALWREHLAEEERERKAAYDRRHLKEHRQVVSFLRRAQLSYDRAGDPGTIARLQRSLAPGLAATRQSLDKIDHWGQSSNVIADYQALLDALDAPYARARLAAVKGDESPLLALRRDFAARLKKVDDWLAYAAEVDVD